MEYIYNNKYDRSQNIRGYNMITIAGSIANRPTADWRRTERERYMPYIVRMHMCATVCVLNELSCEFAQQKSAFRIERLVRRPICINTAWPGIVCICCCHCVRTSWANSLICHNFTVITSDRVDSSAARMLYTVPAAFKPRKYVLVHVHFHPELRP